MRLRKRLARATRGIRVFGKLTWRGRRYQLKRAIAPGITGRRRYQVETLGRTKRKKRRR